jgi:hypothetical protein
MSGCFTKIQAGLGTSCLPRIQSNPIGPAYTYGTEDLINEVAGIILATTGRSDVAPKLLKHFTRGQSSLLHYSHIYGGTHGQLCDAIYDYDIGLRVPLLGLRESPLRYDDRRELRVPRPPETIASYFGPDGVSSLSRLSGMNWSTFGNIVEAHLRGYFGISDEVPISITVYGGVLSCHGRSKDIDLLLVVEDEDCSIVETGGSRPNLICPGASELFPPDFRPLTNELDVAVVGFGAIRSGTLSHDLINTILWASLDGLQIVGTPITREVSDWALCQNVFVFMGYSVKNAFINPNIVGEKLARLISVELSRCMVLGKKYMSTDLAEYDRYSSDIVPYKTIEEFIRSAEILAGILRNLFEIIKKTAVQNVSTLLGKLLT